jgi:Fe-coproporphyrin III synthase
MDAAIITTYRCNARCRMCNTWAHPTKPSEEFAPELLEKLPAGMGRVNITGGEPLIRRDLPKIVDVLTPKAERLEISTNGWFVDRLEAIGRDHPELTIRISIEGPRETNDAIRGLPNGFDRAMESFRRLRSAGVRDLGFGVVMQDDNAHVLVDLYRLVSDLRAEFAQAVPHNSYYFHTCENQIREVAKLEGAIRDLMTEFLKSRRPKEWFRAYLNKGLADYVAGRGRTLACTAGEDIFFLDPHGEVYPCNGRALSMGNLHESSFDEIWHGERAAQVRLVVAACDAGCWMTGTAVPAIKRHLPTASWWILRNKARIAVGKPVDLGD